MMTRKMAAVRSSSNSHLDGHDFSNDQETDQLEAQSRGQHLTAHRIIDEKLRVRPVDHKHHAPDAGRDGCDNAPGHHSLRADTADPGAQLESLPNDMGELIQKF